MTTRLFHCTYTWQDYQGLRTRQRWHVVVFDPADETGSFPEEPAISRAERWFSPSGLGGSAPSGLFQALEAASNARIVEVSGATTYERTAPVPAPDSSEPFPSVLDTLVPLHVVTRFPFDLTPAPGVLFTRLRGLIRVAIPAPLAAAVADTQRNRAGHGFAQPGLNQLRSVLTGQASCFPSDRFGRWEDLVIQSTLEHRNRSIVLPRRVADRTLDATLSLPAL